MENIPKYGQRLADEVRKWGDWIKKKAEVELAELYPKGSDGSTPIAFLWARTALCEGPGCGAKIPLVRSFLLSKRKNLFTGLKIDINKITNEIKLNLATSRTESIFECGTLRRGSATCPICGYTTPGINVRKQVEKRSGGADDSILLAVYCDSSQGRFYREPDESDYAAILKSKTYMEKVREEHGDTGIPVTPTEELPYLRSIFNINLIGVHRWEQMFTYRQLVCLTTLVKLLKECYGRMDNEPGMAAAIATMLGLAIDRQADYSSSICTWVQSGEFVGHTFAQNQCLPIKWDFAEVSPFADGSGNWDGAIDWIVRVIENLNQAKLNPGTVNLQSATQQSLPDDSAQLVFTDPPYYDAVPYADLSDFFYVWLKRSLGNIHPDLFTSETVQKDGEIVQLAERNVKYAYKTREYFERLMQEALQECRRITDSRGLAVIVFAHKETSAWETMLQALISAGWTAVASWPIDTEMGARLRARNSAVLASSVHLVCRPRERGTNSKADEVGDWREVLSELPLRIHDWMPRLAEEGVVGADAIFACLGPALEIYSRYSKVEKASGEVVLLGEFLEQVWGAVAKEALSMVFHGASAEGFEADSRLTAMWLWTLSSGSIDPAQEDDEDATIEGDGSEEAKKKVSGFILEYDAARKIAQGLGAHLEELKFLVEIKGDVARLLPLEERAAFLFGKESVQPVLKRGKSKSKQEVLPGFEELVEGNVGFGMSPGAKAKIGTTQLDRVHQAMLLFGAGRNEAMKAFLVDEGVGKDGRFWRLAQALSALYPRDTHEKRWVDGVLSRKKGLGF